MIHNFTGVLNPAYPPPPLTRYTLHVNNKTFTGLHYDLTWEFDDAPCLYSGNRQGGPIGEVREPNDPVIEGIYTEYIVSGLFETAYIYGRFNETICEDGSGVPFTRFR